MSRVGARHLVPVEEGHQPKSQGGKLQGHTLDGARMNGRYLPPRVDTSCVAGSRQRVWLSGPALSRELRVEPPCMRDATQKTGVVGVTGINMGIEFISPIESWDTMTKRLRVTSLRVRERCG